jgi:Ca2+-binding RTX toxin-like protein
MPASSPTLPLRRVACRRRARVDFDRLVGSIHLEGASDTLSGGDGDDLLIGDQQAAIVAAVAGPVLRADTNSALPAANAPKAVTQADALVDFDNLVGSLDLEEGNDILSGDGGNDRLVGDSDLLVAGIVSGPMATGFVAPTATAAGLTTPTSVNVVSFDSLLNTLDLDAGVDSLNGGAGDDDLIGDNAVSVLAVVAGGDGIGSQPAKLALGVVFEQLLGDINADARATPCWRVRATTA